MFKLDFYLNSRRFLVAKPLKCEKKGSPSDKVFVVNQFRFKLKSIYVQVVDEGELFAENIYFFLTHLQCVV